MRGGRILALEDVILVGAAFEMPEWVAETNEQRRWLLAAIRHLPEERQELLILEVCRTVVERGSRADHGPHGRRDQVVVSSHVAGPAR